MIGSSFAYRSRLVAEAEEGVRLAPNSVYVAPSNRHMLVRPDGTLGLSDADRINCCRPAADVLFRSAAAVYGAGVIGVVLTGYGRDGAMGSRAVQQAGGFVIKAPRLSERALKQIEVAGPHHFRVRAGLGTRTLSS